MHDLQNNNKRTQKKLEHVLVIGFNGLNRKLHGHKLVGAAKQAELERCSK